MKKTAFIPLVLSCAFLIGGSNAFAATGVVEKTVNFRTAPNTDSSTYGFLKSGTRFDVLSTVNKYWLKIQANGKVGYVSTNYVDVNSGSSTSSSTSTRASATGSKIAATAKSYLGDFKYKWGAEPWTTGNKYSDCSAFVQLVFNRKYGYDLPRSSLQQSKEGKYVSKSKLQIGNLVFFDTNNDGKINHVGIYVGGGKFIHCSPSNNKVATNDLTTGFWKSHYVTARNVL